MEYYCSSCKELIGEGSLMGIPPCNHKFHIECSKKLKKQSLACNLCNMSFLSVRGDICVETNRKTENLKHETEHWKKPRDNIAELITKFVQQIEQGKRDIQEQKSHYINEITDLRNQIKNDKRERETERSQLIVDIKELRNQVDHAAREIEEVTIEAMELNHELKRVKKSVNKLKNQLQ